MHVHLRLTSSITLAFLIFLFVPNSFGQEQKSLQSLIAGEFSVDDGCGDPFTESQLYAQRKGKVIKILSSTEVLFQSLEANGNKENRAYTIRLVGISPKQNSVQVEKFLRENVLNRRAYVVGSGIGKKDRQYDGIIRILDEPDIVDLNEYLLKEGLAAYLDFDNDNLVPYYWLCRLERAQTQAKEAKVGIWSTKP